MMHFSLPRLLTEWYIKRDLSYILILWDHLVCIFGLHKELSLFYLFLSLKQKQTHA